jgi:lipopolysaccharide export system protein LptA
MIKKLNVKISWIIGSALLLTMSLNSTHAAKKDLRQEITVDSKKTAADLKNKIASYLGNVKIRQGSILITADLVQVFSKKDEIKKEKSNTYLAKGKPAIFQQELEDGSLISLEADEITYQPSINLITIAGNAIVKQAGSEVSASKITFNTLNEKLEAESNNNETVTTVLQPTILKNLKNDNDKAKAKAKAKEKEKKLQSEIKPEQSKALLDKGTSSVKD